MSNLKSLKALKQEAKEAGVKGYTKLTRDELIQKTADMIEQNAIASTLNLNTLITENKTVPEAQTVEPVQTSEPVEPAEPVAPVILEEKKTRKRSPTKKETQKKERKQTGPNKWQTHVKAYREANKGLSYKQAMIDAKASYQA